MTSRQGVVGARAYHPVVCVAIHLHMFGNMSAVLLLAAITDRQVVIRRHMTTLLVQPLSSSCWR